MSNERIGDYLIGEQLGVGTVGTVSRARHVASGDEVALKILHPSITDEDEIRARFRREITILEKLSHPNIVACYGSGIHEGRHYYTMEIVDGGSLKSVLKEHGRLPWQDVIEIGWHICSALQHAHNQGIIHRDLKPGNLFLTKDGQLKLGDFGLALDMSGAELTSPGVTVGTYYYMAPEQIRGERTISNKTDLYALGCLLFRMLTGRPPFEGSNAPQIFDLHLNAPPPSVRVFAPDCPKDLEDLINKLLAKKQEDRPFNARQVQGLLAEVLMKWDEEQAETSLKQKSQTWAIDTKKPILSKLRHQPQNSATDKITWGALGSMLLGLILIVLIIQQIAQK